MFSFGYNLQPRAFILPSGPAVTLAIQFNQSLDSSIKKAYILQVIMNKEVNKSQDRPVRKPHFHIPAIFRKWCRIGLILIAVIAVVISIMLCLRPDWRQIVWGSLIVIAGSAGSQLLPDWKKHKWFRWVRAVCIGIVVAVGALITTYGWNERDNYFRDRGLLIAAAAEWRLNKTYIHVQSQRRDDYLIRGGHLSTPVFVLPTAREMRQVLTQATSFRDDRLLIHALTLYVMADDKLVPVLEHIDRLCSQPIATMEMKKKAVETDLGRGKDSAFQYFIKAHEQLGNILTSTYPWSLEEAEIRVDKDILDAIEQTWLVLPYDPNRPPGHDPNVTSLNG
jgi:hypothetical protein